MSTKVVIEFPIWQTFTPELVSAELPKLLAEAEQKVAALESSNATDYEGVVVALDEATDQLWHTWGRVSHMLGVANSQAWREVEEKFQPDIVAFSLRVGQSKPIYQKTKAALGHETDSIRRRILEKMIEAAEHAGVGLEGTQKTRFNEIQTRLAQLAADFNNAVIDATTPDIADAVYVETMKHESDRSKREAAYRKRSTRASANDVRIGEILALRKELAAILGYADYASLSLSSKCAPSVAAVMKMIDELDRATVTAEASERQELAAETSDKVEPWDVAYLAERLKERKYAYSENELKQYFKFSEVLAGLFRLVKFLFGVEVVELVGDERPDAWNDKVRFFAVREGAATIAHFYLDAYVRAGSKSGGAWMNEFRNRNDRKGQTPLAVVVLNLKDDLMPLREVETLFHEFGHALQCMLTRVGEEDAAGINLVEWDAVEVASQFMENWCLDDHTGIKVPEELKHKVRAAKNFRAASVCRRQLAFAKTDMELHSADCVDAPDVVKARNFAHFNLPIIEGDRFLSAFTHIFAGGYAAGYYGYKWAEVMSADCFGAFEEAGLDQEPKLKALGQHYRETILALGGSKSALAVFREFRGRDPQIAAILRQSGLEGSK